MGIFLGARGIYHLLASANVLHQLLHICRLMKNMINIRSTLRDVTLFPFAVACLRPLPLHNFAANKAITVKITPLCFTYSTVNTSLKVLESILLETEMRHVVRIYLIKSKGSLLVCEISIKPKKKN